MARRHTKLERLSWSCLLVLSTGIAALLGVTTISCGAYGPPPCTVDEDCSGLSGWVCQEGECVPGGGDAGVDAGR